MHTLAIHGGAGVVLARLPQEQRPRYERSLAAILDQAFEVLDQGGACLDAVAMAVRLLEDDPLFNAGYGAGLAQDGSVELDAAIMDGRTLKAGAVGAIKHLKNPIELARRVMDDTQHVLMVGSGAEEFALQCGMQLVNNDYFKTTERRRQLENAQRGRLAELAAATPNAVGTVGAVALDSRGNLAAGTSTGGMTNKLPGRLGDSPLIGAGTYAKNGVCAVSATGHGEYFIRTVAAHHIAAAVEYRHVSLGRATHELIHDVLLPMAGLGGVIAVDAAGSVSMEFNTEGMFRASRDSNGNRVVAITR